MVAVGRRGETEVMGLWWVDGMLREGGGLGSCVSI